MSVDYFCDVDVVNDCIIDIMVWVVMFNVEILLNGIN